jgi:eukaryotic-like serine/threonine-protein kinase
VSPPMDTLLSNRYGVVRSIGTGAITEVLEALDRVTGARVAIKVPIGRFKNDRTLLVRLEREIAALAGFQHPNVAMVHAVERQGDTGFVVTELVDAPSLRQVLAVRGRLSPARAARAAVGICAALASAHTRGIVHGHLTLDNVLMTGDGRVKVTDFRLAEAARPFARAPDPAIDLRALGRCLTAMLTGTEPSGRGPVHLGPDIPTELAAIVRLATGNPPDSYGSAAAIGRDLDRFLATVRPNVLPVDGRAAAVPRDAPFPAAAHDAPTPGVGQDTPFPAAAQHAPAPAAAPEPPGAVTAMTAELVPVPVAAPTPGRGRHGAVGSQRRRRGLVVVACLVAAALAVGASMVATQRSGDRPGTTVADLAAPPPPTSGLPATTGRTPATTRVPTTAKARATPVASPPTTSPTSTTTRRPGQRTVPKVVGLHRQQASRMLQQAGLTARISVVPVKDASQIQRVIAVQPAAGTVVPTGSVVTLVVGGRKASG